MTISKISLLPAQLREQLNLRLENNQSTKSLLDWLNGLPEVQSLFAGQPITPKNLCNWRNNEFRQWQLRRSALQFLGEFKAADPSGKLLSSEMVEKLAQWLSLRYAASAAKCCDSGNSESDLESLHKFCAAITALRRGELLAARVAIEQQRLDHLKARTAEEEEVERWEWTKRPDVHAKLYANEDPEKVRRDVERIINRKLLGIRDPDETDETQSPACLI